MVEQWLGPERDRCDWSSSLAAREPQAWHDFLVALANRWPEHGVAKIQCTGPITLASALMQAGGAAHSHRELLVAAHELAVWLADGVRPQVRDLRARGLKVLLVIDEPLLASVEAENCEVVWDPLRRTADAWGLHLCCSVPWGVIDAAAPDVLSFDLARGRLDALASETLDRMIERGGRVAWGCVAPHHDEGSEIALQRLEAAVDSLTLERDFVGSHSLITASCGSALVTEHREVEIVEALTAISSLLRAEDLARASRRAP